MKKWLFCLLMLALCVPLNALADADVYTLTDESGNVLTRYCGECEKGDEYISRDNRHYRVSAVDHERKTASAELIGQAEMPDISWLDAMDSQPVASVGQRKIALYCTHSDESYITGDGTESVTALLHEVVVQPGASVLRGAVIGSSTENLYFELRQGGESADPTQKLGL